MAIWVDSSLFRSLNLNVPVSVVIIIIRYEKVDVNKKPKRPIVDFGNVGMAPYDEYFTDTEKREFRGAEPGKWK